MKKSANYKITKISVNNHEVVDYLEINHETVPVASGTIETNKVVELTSAQSSITPSSGYGAMEKVTYTVKTYPTITKGTPTTTDVKYSDTAPNMVNFSELATAFDKWAIIDDDESAVLGSASIGSDITVTFADIVADTDKIIVCWGYPSTDTTASAIKTDCYYSVEIENPKA